MKIAMFDTHAYERGPFEDANARFGHELTFLEPRLTEATSHQAFLTTEALNNIAAVTLENVTAFERGEPLQNQVHALWAVAPTPS